VRPYLKKKSLSQKRAGGVTQDVGSEFKPQNCQKKKKKRRRLADWLKRACLGSFKHEILSSNSSAAEK
jgi:hypothetical protein